MVSSCVFLRHTHTRSTTKQRYKEKNQQQEYYILQQTGLLTFLNPDGILISENVVAFATFHLFSPFWGYYSVCSFSPYCGADLRACAAVIFAVFLLYNTVLSFSHSGLKNNV